MEQRLIDANDQVLWRLSVVMPDGNRYVPWEAIAEVPTAIEKATVFWKKSDTPCEHFKCSVCGWGAWYYDYQGDIAKSRFCPNCGAKMDRGAGNAN